MAQLTLRVDDALADDLRSLAARRGESVNAMATTILRAYADPGTAGDEMEEIRERLARAGLLAEPALKSAGRPDPEAVAEAGRRAAQGKLVSEILLEDRD
jgi:plasmid stability protein